MPLYCKCTRTLTFEHVSSGSHRRGVLHTPLWFRVYGVGFGVWGLGLYQGTIEGLGFRVEGLGTLSLQAYVPLNARSVYVVYMYSLSTQYAVLYTLLRISLSMYHTCTLCLCTSTLCLRNMQYSIRLWSIHVLYTPLEYTCTLYASGVYMYSVRLSGVYMYSIRLWSIHVLHTPLWKHKNVCISLGLSLSLSSSLALSV